MAQPLDPHHRAIGYSYTYRTYVFQVSQGIALHPPPRICPIAAEGRGWQGVSQLKLPSGGYRAIRGIAEIVSPIAVSWATKSAKCSLLVGNLFDNIGRCPKLLYM